MKLKYTGPSGQVNYEVGMEVGHPELEPDAEYDLSAELAARLLESSAWFVPVDGSHNPSTDD